MEVLRIIQAYLRTVSLEHIALFSVSFFTNYVQLDITDIQSSSHCRALFGHVLWHNFVLDFRHYRNCLNALAMIPVVNRDVNRLVVRMPLAPIAQYQFQNLVTALEPLDIETPFCLDFVPGSVLDEMSWSCLETVATHLLPLDRISIPGNVSQHIRTTSISQGGSLWTCLRAKTGK